MECKCIDCSRRCIGCHSKCDDYAEYRKHIDDMSRRERKRTETLSFIKAAAVKRKEEWRRQK